MNGRQGRRHAGQLVLRRFTQSYLLLLLIPIALCVSAYLSARNMAEQHILENNRLILRHAIDRLENSIAEAEQFTLTLSQMNDVVQAMQAREPLDRNALYAIHQAIRYMPTFRDANGIISKYLLYSHSGDFLLTPNKAYINLERYYTRSLCFEGMDYAAWHGYVLDMTRVTGLLPSVKPLYLFDTAQASILLQRPFIAASATRTGLLYGKALFFIQVKDIFALLSPALETGAEQIYVLDRTGTPLTSLIEDEEPPFEMLLAQAEGTRRVRVHGREMALAYERGEATGLTVAILTPMSAILARSGALLNTLLIVMGTLLVLGGGFLFIVMQRNRKPLARLITRLPGDARRESGSLHSLWDVDRAVHQMATRQERLEQEVCAQKAQMRAAFIHQLISGSIRDEMELEAWLSHIDLPLRGGAFRGVYLEVSDGISLSEDTLIQADYTQRIVLEALQPLENRLQYLTMLDHAHYVLLYANEDGRDDALNAFFGEVYRTLKTRHGLHALFFVGHPCMELKALHQSFAAACHLMDLNERCTDQFLFVAAYARESGNGYVYSVRDEQRLVSLAGKGKRDALLKELDSLYQKNFVGLQLGGLMERLLYHRMIGTLALHEESGFTGDMGERLAGLTGRAFFHALGEAYAHWCAHSLERMEVSQNRLIQDVLDHIHAQYQDPSMGLAAVALHFGVTESHLSQFFKEKVGKTFSVYLETLRIEQANQLLLTTASTIDEIARVVGYINADTFRRAYRRVHGYTPSQHRNAAL